MTGRAFEAAEVPYWLCAAGLGAAIGVRGSAGANELLTDILKVFTMSKWYAQPGKKAWQW